MPQLFGVLVSQSSQSSQRSSKALEAIPGPCPIVFNGDAADAEAAIAAGAAAVVADAFFIAGAALGRDVILVADHVANIPDGEDEGYEPKAVEDVRDRGQGHAAVRGPAVVVVAEAREDDDDDVEEEEVGDDLHAYRCGSQYFTVPSRRRRDVCSMASAGHSTRLRAAALALLRVLLLVHLAEDHRVRAAPHRHAARADVATAGT